MAEGVQIVTDLAQRITRMFDETGASQIERHSALKVAKALIVVSAASLTSDSTPLGGAPEESAEGSNSGSESR